MRYLIAKWLVVALSLLLVAYLIPGISIESTYTALIVAAVLGLVHLLIKPILIILTLPITILTLGLFSFVINALLFWFVASFIKGFEVSGFFSAFLGALVVSVISSFAMKFIKAID